MILSLDHVAILVADVDATAAGLPAWLRVHGAEEHPGEGTRERYACPASDDDPALLLLQAVEDGPYRAALEKRGPGLHHLACNTDALEAAVRYFAGHGMLLHPISIETLKRRVVWLCRPGFPFLLELCERSGLESRPQTQLTLRLPAGSARVPVEFVPSARVTSGGDGLIHLRLGDASCRIDPFAQ